MPRAHRLLPAAAAAALVLASGAPAQARAESSLQQAFARAAAAYHVPQGVLLAVAYEESRFDAHAGRPSFSGGFGPMHLTDAGATLSASGKVAYAPDVLLDPSRHTASAAARLAGTPVNVVRHSAAANVRAGAALLASYERAVARRLPRDPAAWYAAVARYSQARDQATAAWFADRVYARLRAGASRVNDQGQRVTLRPQAVTPDRGTLAALHLARRVDASGMPDCPPVDTCNVVPAAYTLNNPTDPYDYGNYDLALRPQNGLDIRYVVVHDTEENYADTLATFENPHSYTSAHYVIRSADGLVTQMVPNADVAWHANNWYVNTHAIGIEHEGFAAEGSWFTEAMYQASAALVRHLSLEYGFPRDRLHIIGHDNVPATAPGGTPAMHWDPGPYWNWQHYMALMGTTFHHRDRSTGVVTITPDYAAQQPQPVNYLAVHTAPSAESALITDPVMGPGTTAVDAWWARAAYGQRFVLAQRQGDWAGIWFDGQLGWVYDPAGRNTRAGSGLVVTPRAGLASIPTYGTAWPESSAYPPGLPQRTVVPLEYTIPAGQRYVATGPFTSDVYVAPTYTLNPNDHTVVKGTTQYYQVSYAHRFVYVNAADVDVAGS